MAHLKPGQARPPPTLSNSTCINQIKDEQESLLGVESSKNLENCIAIEEKKPRARISRQNLEKEKDERQGEAKQNKWSSYKELMVDT
jgi:hypothetical protein